MEFIKLLSWTTIRGISCTKTKKWDSKIWSQFHGQFTNLLPNPPPPPLPHHHHHHHYQQQKTAHKSTETVLYSCLFSGMTPSAPQLTEFHLMLELLSNWILTSCQPHRITSGWSDSVVSKCIFQSSSDISTFSKVNPQNTTPTQTKKNIHTRTANRNFQRVSPFNICCVKTLCHNWPGAYSKLL